MVNGQQYLNFIHYGKYIFFSHPLLVYDFDCHFLIRVFSVNRQINLAI